jgi:hypothetical protein
VPPKSLKLSPLIVVVTLVLIVASMYWARLVLIAHSRRHCSVDNFQTDVLPPFRLFASLVFLAPAR